MFMSGFPCNFWIVTNQPNMMQFNYSIVHHASDTVSWSQVRYFHTVPPYKPWHWESLFNHGSLHWLNLGGGSLKFNIRNLQLIFKQSHHKNKFFTNHKHHLIYLFWIMLDEIQMEICLMTILSTSRFTMLQQSCNSELVWVRDADTGIILDHVFFCMLRNEYKWQAIGIKQFITTMNWSFGVLF